MEEVYICTCIPYQVLICKKLRLPFAQISLCLDSLIYKGHLSQDWRMTKQCCSLFYKASIHIKKLFFFRVSYLLFLLFIQSFLLDLIYYLFFNQDSLLFKPLLYSF